MAEKEVAIAPEIQVALALTSDNGPKDVDPDQSQVSQDPNVSFEDH